MKHLSSGLIVIILLISIVACGVAPTQKPSPTFAPMATNTPINTITPTSTQTPTPTPVPIAWKSLGPEGGLINTLVIDPKTPTTLYAGTDGGVYKSMDGGENWVAINHNLKLIYINSLTIDPAHTNIIYAGSYAGTNGILFKSKDGGENWESAGEGFENAEIVSLTFDPADPGTLFAYTINNFFVSRDEGSTWVAQNLTGQWSYLIDPQPLAFDASNPNIIYAGRYHEVLKSADGGKNWNKLSDRLCNNQSTIYSLLVDPATHDLLVGTDGCGLIKISEAGAVSPSGSLDAKISVLSLALDPKTPGTIYAGGHSGVYKTADGGSTWKPANNGLANSDIQNLIIDPVTSNNLYVGTRNGVYKSTDGGENWEFSSKGLSATSIFALAVDPQTPATLYAGNYGFGLFKSKDGGNNWNQLDNIKDNRIGTVLIDPMKPDNIYVGASLSVPYKSTDGGETWSGQKQGKEWISALAIEPDNPNILYAGRNSFNDATDSYHGIMLKSTDGGGSWLELAIGAISDITAIVVDPQKSSTLYVGTGEGAYKSLDSGMSWRSISKGLPNKYGVAVLIIDPVEPATLYAGTNEGVFKTTDGGESWSALTNGPSTSTRSLAIDPQTPTIIYAGTSGEGVFKSTDGGASWTGFNEGLTENYINILVFDPTKSTTLYAGTEGGIYIIDQGK